MSNTYSEFSEMLILHNKKMKQQTVSLVMNKKRTVNFHYSPHSI